MKSRLDVLVTTASTTGLRHFDPTAPVPARFRVGKDANAPGGFLARFVWGPATGVSNTSNRAFCGLDGDANVPTDVENSAKVTGLVGMGWDSADANIQIMHNDLSGRRRRSISGRAFRCRRPTGAGLRAAAFSPNSLTQSVSYRVIRYDKTDNTIAAGRRGRSPPTCRRLVRFWHRPCDERWRGCPRSSASPAWVS